jgi:putative heme iron utilization protein
MAEAPPDPVPRDPRQPADFNPIALGKALLRASRLGTLGTLEPQTGFPFATLTNVATDIDGAPLILVSRLSTHTQNLLHDERVSLLLSRSGQNARAEKGDPMAHPRLTVQAYARLVVDSALLPRIRRRYLARHPKAQIYVDFPDFAFFRLEPTGIHLNGGFARAFDGPAASLMAPLADLAGFAALEEEALAHLNAEHVETLALCAEMLCGKDQQTGSNQETGGGRWRAASLDPDGLDLMRGDEVLRVAFPARVETAQSLHEALHALAQSARAAKI